MNKYIFLFLTTSVGTLRAQSVILPLTDRGTDAEFVKTMMVANVFEFRGDTVSNPLDFASAKKDDQVIWRKVKSPTMSKRYRKGFTWVFTGVKTDDFARSHTLVLIENPGWTAYNALIWTDRNNNYDLTDDGAPDTLKPNKTAVVSMDYQTNGLKIMLEHFPVSLFKQFAVINDNAMYQLQGNRLFSGTENSFRLRRMNVIYGTWSDGKKKMALCVKDANCNGLYDDNGVDEVMIADDGRSFQNLQSCVLKNGKAYLEWNSAAFYIDGVSRDGSFIKFTRDTNANLKYTLNKGKKLPRFRYAKPVTKTKAKTKTRKRGIRRFKGDKLYIYVWHDQASGYFNDSSALHALGRIKESGCKVLMLNYGASSQYLHRYSRRYETFIYQGYSSNKINKKLKILKIPTGIFIDKTQRILGVNYSPNQVIEYLKVNEIKTN